MFISKVRSLLQKLYFLFCHGTHLILGQSENCICSADFGMVVYRHNPDFGLKGALADATLNTMLVEMMDKKRHGEYVLIINKNHSFKFGSFIDKFLGS